MSKLSAAKTSPSSSGGGPGRESRYCSISPTCTGPGSVQQSCIYHKEQGVRSRSCRPRPPAERWTCSPRPGTRETGRPHTDCLSTAQLVKCFFHYLLFDCGLCGSPAGGDEVTLSALLGDTGRYCSPLAGQSIQTIITGQHRTRHPHGTTEFLLQSPVPALLVTAHPPLQGIISRISGRY